MLPENGAWYLLALMIFTALPRCAQNAPTPVLLAVGGTASAVAGTGPITEHSFVWNNVFFLFVFFLFVFFAAGSRWARWAPPLTEHLGRSQVALPLTACVAGAALAATGTGALSVPGVHLFLGAIAVLAGLTVSRWVAPSWAGRALAALGRDTLGVYLVHEVAAGLVVLAFTGIVGSAVDGAARWLLPPVLVAVVLVRAIPLARCLRRIPGLLSAPWDRSATPRVPRQPSRREAVRADRTTAQ
ncbi:acyltransferase family protein [Kineococcus auxinigenes]|uniref:acyltransferase family protein n=1 Tax=unclassified Kineococcus TaxID=2621656 RepID=UPI003D7CB2BE